ncbi:MAG: beta-ketoacyl-ACP synthase II [candidate division WOR-3 bacterium]
MMRRVAVTGLGAVTPLGNDVPSLWHELLEGRSGIGRVTKFDPAGLAVQIAGEVKNFEPARGLDPKLARRTDAFTQYALVATAEAVRDAGLDFRGEDPRRCGVVIGSGMGGVATWENEHIRFLEKGPSRVSPLLIPMMIPDMAAGQVAIQYQAKGPNFATVSACASGAHGIGTGGELIALDKADVIIAGGSEAAITAYTISAFANMQALSRRNDAPEKASRPFDRDRDGFVIAEGAGIVVLEEMGHAQQRGARVYAELAGYGATSDGYHITAPDPEGNGAYEAMLGAIRAAGIGLDEVDYVNAHGTSTSLNDLTETLAIKRLFGEHASRLVVNSTKSMIGHALGAAGAIEFVVTCLSVYHQQVHRTLNLENPDDGMDLDYVPEGARRVRIRAALCNSFGFGGHNCSLLARRVES